MPLRGAMAAYAELKAKYMPLPPAGRHIRNRLQATTGAQLADAEETTEYMDYADYLRTTKYIKHTKMPRRRRTWC